MIYLKNKPIIEFSYITDARSVSETAAAAFNKYVEKLCGTAVGRAESGGAETIRFSVSEGVSDDCARIEFDGRILTFGGGKRGVIYAVYVFLEEYVGCRFFAEDCEILPRQDVYLNAFSYSHSPRIDFRMYLGNAAQDDEFSLKRRFNGMLWNTHDFGEAQGGGYDFAGIPVHSLTGEYLLKPYISSNPEFFSLVGGKRLTDRKGQVCMTNSEALKAVVREARKILDENKDKRIISVSQGDNGNFCECEECRRAVEKQGLAKTYFSFVNGVAAALKESHPCAKVHTLAYQKTLEVPDELQFENNVLIQYCTGDWCRIHAITDTSCRQNVKMKAIYDHITDGKRAIYIWDYLNCFKHELLLVPDFFNILTNFKYFADSGVKGLLLEAEHRASDGYAAMHELRCYLASLAAWDPDMPYEAYLCRMKEFICAYYGSDNVYKAVRLYADESASAHCTYDGWRFNRPVDNAVTADTSRLVVARLFRPERLTDTMNEIYRLLDTAYETATVVQKQRLDKVYACMLWYELYHTMSETLAHGTLEQKECAYRKNGRLVRYIFEYRLKLTFWGRNIDDQLVQMKNENYEKLPPDKWNYDW